MGPSSVRNERVPFTQISESQLLTLPLLVCIHDLWKLEVRIDSDSDADGYREIGGTDNTREGTVTISESESDEASNKSADDTLANTERSDAQPQTGNTINKTSSSSSEENSMEEEQKRGISEGPDSSSSSEESLTPTTRTLQILN